MPTKTSNGTGGGEWSVGGTWVGGVAPVDGDTVVIAAGDTVLFDADLSAWTTGVAGLTISSGAVTPGKLDLLVLDPPDNPLVLPIKAGTKIQGTSGAVKGRLYAGTASVPLINSNKFTIKLMGTGSGGGQIDRTYLDVQLRCAQPTHKWVKLSQDENIGATVLHVDTDVTADIWAEGDVVALCNVNKGCDYQRTTIAAGGIAATTITVTNPLDSLNIAGSYLVRVTRNIEVTSEGSQPAITATSGTNCNGVWNCSVRQTGIVQGYGAAYGSGDSFGGVFNGFSQGIGGAAGYTMSGCAVGCSSGIASTYFNNIGSTISGLVAGNSSYGVFDLFGGLFTGIVAGCGTGFGRCLGLHVAGQVHGCNYGLQYCGQCHVSGSITFCNYGFCYSAAVLKQGTAIGGSGSLANSGDIYLANGVYRGYGAGLRSATQVTGYLNTNPYPVASAILYDVADASGNPQPGRMKWWNCGGYGASEDWAQGVHGDPPVPLVYVHKHTFETASYDNWVDVPIWGEMNVPLIIRVYIRKQQNGMAATPWMRLIDPSRPLGDAEEILASSTMGDNTNWQTLTLDYIPDWDRQFMLRVGARNASGTMYWDFDVRTSGRRPGMRVMGV